MTLCIAWLDGEGVHFASDSRVSTGGGYSDTGVKVFAVPVTVFPPKMAGGPDPLPLYHQTLGMCTAGSLLNVYNVAEILRDVLPALYVTPWHPELSMDDLCKIIANLFEEISRRVCESLAGKAGTAELLLGGFCREKKQIRVFRLALNSGAFPLSVDVRELDLSGGPECLGSGAAAAQQLFAVPPKRHPLKVLKAVVLDVTVPTVGGCIQFGEFTGEDFHTMGVEDYIIDRDGFANVGVFIRGVKIFEPGRLETWGTATPRVRAILPFESEIDELFEKGLVRTP